MRPANHRRSNASITRNRIGRYLMLVVSCATALSSCGTSNRTLEPSAKQLPEPASLTELMVPPVENALAGMSPKLEESVGEGERTISKENLYLPVPEKWPGRIGMGYNTLTGELGAPCVEGKVKPNVEKGGQKVYSRYHAVSSFEQLWSMWKLDGSAAFDAGIWKASGSLSYTRERAISRFNADLVAEEVVVNPIEILTEFNLTEDARKALQQGRQAFFEKCGDHFIVSQLTGGRFDVVASINTETVREQNTLDVNTGGSYYEVAGTLNFSESFKREFESRVQNAKILREGGISDLPGKSLADLEAAGKAFPPTVAKNPWVLEMATAPIFLAKDVQVKDVVDLKPARDYVAALAAKKYRAIELQNAARWALRNTYQYVVFDAAKVKRLDNELESLIVKINEAADKCLKSTPNLTPCKVPIVFNLPSDDVLPRRVLQDRVYIGVDGTNRGLLGAASPFLDGKAIPYGFTFTDGDQQINIGRDHQACAKNTLYDFSGGYCSDRARGGLKNKPTGPLDVPVYRGVAGALNQGRLSTTPSFGFPTHPGTEDKTLLMRRQISEMYGYMRKLPQ